MTVLTVKMQECGVILFQVSRAVEEFHKPFSNIMLFLTYSLSRLESKALNYNKDFNSANTYLPCSIAQLQAPGLLTFSQFFKIVLNMYIFAAHRFT